MNKEWHRQLPSVTVLVWALLCIPSRKWGRLQRLAPQLWQQQLLGKSSQLWELQRLGLWQQ